MMRYFGLGAGLLLMGACGRVGLEEALTPPEETPPTVQPSSDASAPTTEADGASPPTVADAGAAGDGAADAGVVDASDAAAPVDAALEADADADAATTDTVVQIGTGNYRTCFVFASGIVKCVGGNYNFVAHGQGGRPKLGDGVFAHLPRPCPASGWDCALKPVTVKGVTDAVEVAVGQSSACARRAGGSVVCWGENSGGQIGDGTFDPRLTATPVIGLVDAVQVTVGEYAACARRATGDVVCWGNNRGGTLGDGTLVERSATPVAVYGLTDAIDLSQAAWGACAVRLGGAVVCWGSNAGGRLGAGPGCGAGCGTTPVDVVGITDAVAVSSSISHACAMRANGTMVCWGAGQFGALGDGLSTSSSVPVAVSGMTDAVAINATDETTCALRATGQVACWGRGGGYGLGLPAGSGDRTTPNDVPGLTDATRISRGYAFVSTQCVIRPMGRVSCWGENYAGETGNGAVARTYVPTDVVW